MGLIQGSEEWLAMRKNYIGASDASVIMGSNPWRSIYSLWKDKLGLETDQVCNVAMERGTFFEPVAREKLTQELGIELNPDVRFHHKLPYMMASLDAISPDGKVLIEIKVPGKNTHQKALDGIVPEHYFAQCQHQLEVCGLNEMFYYSFDGKDGVMLKVIRDDKFLQELLRKEKEFWECVTNLEAPELTEKDYTQREDSEWINKATHYLLMKEKAKTIENTMDSLKKDLIQLSGNFNSQGAGLKLFRTVRKGNIDYSNIPELSGVDLEKYRKLSSESWRII